MEFILEIRSQCWHSHSPLFRGEDNMTKQKFFLESMYLVPFASQLFLHPEESLSQLSARDKVASAFSHPSSPMG